MIDGFAIEILQPTGSRASIQLEQRDSFTIGRDPTCDVVLPLPAVSRVHLRVHRDDRGLWVSDQSSNGTRIDGELIHSATVPLPASAELHVGQ